MDAHMIKVLCLGYDKGLLLLVFFYGGRILSLEEALLPIHFLM
jgi:hypothetical protein